MFEYEEVDDGITPFNAPLEAVLYFSFSFYPSDRVSLVSTTYYQPPFRIF